MPVEARVRQYLRAVRRRWRVAATARGLAAMGVAAFLLTVLAVLGANAWRFSDHAVLITRIILWSGIVLVIAFFLVRPLLKRLSDARLARFIEEKHPELQDRLVTAVDLAEKGSPDENAKLFEHLLAEDALARAASAPPAALIERRKIFRPLIWASGSLAMLVLLAWLGPGVFRYGTKILWVGWAQPKAPPLYQLRVAPGNIVVGRNSDQEIKARPLGFLPKTVRLFVLYQDNPGWESAAMLPEERGGGFHFLLMNIRKPIEYYAESNGVLSQHYRISVVDVPHVKRLELRYHYPAYTGMKDTVEPSGGDIVALRGTQVTVIAHTDIPASGGQMVLDNGAKVPLSKIGDRELQGTLAVSKDALYHIALQDHLGREAKASDTYLIQALTDAPPTLRIVRPGHDMQPSPIEEVVIGLQAQDDIRMGELQLHYSINGGPEKAVTLARGGLGKDVSATHTLPLENFHLVPGDLISFYGVAKDAGSNATRSEMFFLQVRPFERNYSQAQTSGSGGGQGNTFLSERQKQVISATWNVVRKQDQQKQAQRKPGQFAGQAQVLSSVEGLIRQQAQNLAGRTAGRELGNINDAFSAFVDNLKKAADAMEPAAKLLKQEKFKDALQPEQTALQHLLRAEAMYRDIQVAFGNAGGGGSAGSASRDLAELFALELDRGKNQYETLHQMSDKGNNAAMRDAMRKLEELARRQQDLSRDEQQNQKDSMRAANRWQQEMLRRDTEELARKLQQLSRQMNSSQMQQASNALSQAARDMQRASQSGQQAGGQQGSAERARAEERLQEAHNLVAGQQNQSNEETMQRLAENADQIARQQRKITEEVQRAAADALAPGRSSRKSQQSQMAKLEMLEHTLQEKRNLLAALNNLQQQISDAAARLAASQQKKAAQKLRGAGSMIQDEQMEDKIRQGAWLEEREMWPMAFPAEDNLRAGMDKLAERIKDAQKSLGQTKSQDRLQEALNLAQRVRHGLESLERERAALQGSRTGNQEGSPQGSNQQQQQTRRQGQQGQSGEGRQAGSRGGQQYGRSGGHPSGGLPSGSFGGTFSGRNTVGGEPSRPLTPEEARQLEREYRNLAKQAAGLPRMVAGDQDLGPLAKELVAAMEGMDARKLGGKAKDLTGALIDRWKEMELRLGRRMEGENANPVRLAGRERIPDRYQSVLEEYYRLLSRSVR